MKEVKADKSKRLKTSLALNNQTELTISNPTREQIAQRAYELYLTRGARMAMPMKIGCKRNESYKRVGPRSSEAGGDCTQDERSMPVYSIHHDDQTADKVLAMFTLGM